MSTPAPIHVIGGGLAGSEAAWQIAQAGVPVVLHEMRPVRGTEAHKTDGLAELVCSNSFRSDDAETNAVGLLHAEMRPARLADHALRRRQPGAGRRRAGGRPRRLRRRGHGGARGAIRSSRSSAARSPGCRPPTGTASSSPPARSPRRRWPRRSATLTGEDSLAFFDAIAPIVHRESIDMDMAWFQSRYDKAGPGGTGADYINCPLDQRRSTTPSSTA